ncbi:hypothetical protein [Ensifer sp. ENS06]|uniref:hypothetical protein n=1 Tax=Ensifer sp. ENS06 TaxID=2769276 RepID=UPI001FF04FD4|nr:hypothetical protein [Ensifer sp. ENS06]
MVRSLIALGRGKQVALAEGQSEPQVGVPAILCKASFREETRRLFVDVVQRHFIGSGVRPAPRPVFRKVHGVAKATLRINQDISERYRQGLFSYREFAAWVRFSSDTSPDTADASRSTIGIGIKLFGLRGETLDADDPHAGTADLLMQNHDRFFVDTGQDFCEFSHAAVNGDFDTYLAEHPETKAVLDEMAKPESSLLTATYWSVLPYACGPEAIVKYRLRPMLASNEAAHETDPNFLKLDLAHRLSASEATFEFAIQPFSSQEETPVDAATRRWPTSFVPVGSLVFERQDVNRIGQELYGDNLSINPWRTPLDNRPLGSIADSRRITYRSSAYVRRTANGVAAVEPGRPR